MDNAYMHKPNQDNRGLSIVELIIAISIGVIVSAAIAGLITFAIRTYRNESVNTAMQYELQTNINLIMDEIMGSQTIVVVQNRTTDMKYVNSLDTPGSAKQPYTKYVLLGNPNYRETPTSDVKFKGVVFVTSALSGSTFKLYMNRIEKAIPDTETLDSFALTEANAAKNDVYLLGENLTQFVIEPDRPDLDDLSKRNSFDDTDNTYTNPIPVRVLISFARKGWGSKEYTKHVDEITYLRNRISGDINVNGTVYKRKQ